MMNTPRMESAFALALAVATPMVTAALALEEMKPYAGVEYKQSWTRGQDTYHGLFPKTYPGFRVAMGSRFHENFGIESGFEWTDRKPKIIGLQTSSAAVIGQDLGPGSYGQTFTTSEIHFSGFHVDLNNYWPLGNGVEGVGRIGMGYSKAFLKTNISSDAYTASGARAGSAWSENKLRLRSELIARVGLGLQWTLSDSVAVRALVGWENYARFRDGDNEKMFKDNVSLTTGLSYKF